MSLVHWGALINYYSDGRLSSYYSSSFHVTQTMKYCCINSMLNKNISANLETTYLVFFSVKLTLKIVHVRNSSFDTLNIILYIHRDAFPISLMIYDKFNNILTP